MAIDDSNEHLRILGPGQTELVVALSDDRREMVFGMQIRRGHGEIGCIKEDKKSAKRIVDRLADMHFLMKGRP